MARNGSGSYSLPSGNPVVTGTTISSTDFNNTMTDLATALTGSVAVDGQSPMTGNLPMGGNRVTGLADGATNTDAATYGQIGMSLLAHGTASGSTSIDFTGLAGSKYSSYMLVVNGLVPAINATSFLVRISTGSGFLSAAYRHATWRWTPTGSGQAGSSSDTQWIPSSASETCGTGANQLTSYSITILDASATYPTRRAVWSASGLWASGNYVFMQGGGEVDTQSVPIDGVQCLMSVGNIASGTFYLYGLRNS